MKSNSVTVFAPASVANVGPFYDTMGYCLDHLGDIIYAEKTLTHQDFKLVELTGTYSDELKNMLSDEGTINNVDVVARHINETLRDPNNSLYGDSSEHQYGIDITLHKLMPLQSGLGSSAASCVAAAKAIFHLMGIEDTLQWDAIGEPMIEAEKSSSQHFYPDNILPSYYGGFHSMSISRLVAIPVKPFFTTIFLPNQSQLFTGAQRDKVEDYIMEILKYAGSEEARVEKVLDMVRFQSNAAATVVSGLIAGDWKQVGEVINSSEETNFLYQSRCMSDTLGQDLFELAAIKGSFATSLSGSGPSYFALSDSLEKAVLLRDIITNELEGFKDCKWLISEVNVKGACIINSVEEFIEKNKKHHNFW